VTGVVALQTAVSRVDRNGTDQYTRVRTDRRHATTTAAFRVSGREYARAPVGVGTFAGPRRRCGAG